MAERLQRVTAALSATTSIDEAARVGVEQMAASLDAAAGALALVDEQRRALVLAAFCGASPERFERFRAIPLDTEGVPAVEALRAPRPLLIETPDEMARRFPRLVPSLDPRYRAWAIVPLRVESRAIGVAWFLFTQPRRFSADDEATMMSIAGQGAQAIARAQLLETERRTRAELGDELAAMQKLHAISTSLVEGSALEPLLQQILDAAIAIQGADKGLVQLYDARDCVLRAVVHRGFDAAVVEHFRVVPPGVGARGAAVVARGRVIVTDATTDELFAPMREVVHAAGFRGVQSTPLLSRHGELLGMLSTHHVEARAPSARDLRLLDLLARQAADLIDRTRAIDALREAARRKDEFLATLAHELRNPLAPIRTAVELLRTTDDAATARRGRAVIERQALHLARLVDDLMDMARINQGKLELRRERTPLARVLDGAIEASRPLLERRGHELAIEIDDGVGDVDGDPVRLAQVFSNLLNNAAKFTPPGGHIRLRAFRDGARVTVKVSDDGPGIARDMLAHIFEPFVQSSTPAGRDTGGLGVGLTLVRQIVQLHGGAVSAASDGPGTGAELTVELPAAEGAATPAMAAATGACPALRRRVLVVDDNRDAAETLAEWLASLGHDVRTAFDGRAALDQAAAQRPEVVLLDIGLPDMDGHEVARRLRATSCPRAMLIALTGWGQERDRQRSEGAGIDVHLVKPADLDQVQRLLHEATAAS